MKRGLTWLIGALVLAWVWREPVRAATTLASGNPASPPGVELASAVTQITGIAISPLLGMGTVGAIKYFRAAPAARPSLPWFAQPWFWGPALFLVLICIAKDAAGPALPKVFKKPLDLAELFENKLSGLIATGAIVPLALAIFHSVDEKSASLAGAGFAAIDASPFLNALMVPLALAMYGVVWLVSHATHILILISPFGMVDTAIKAFRAAVLGSVVLTHWIDARLGLVWAVVIIVVCAFLSGWAFRLLVFGNSFGWDLVTFRNRRFLPDSRANKVFLARKIEGVPTRTLGKLEKQESGALVFRYRPWLLLPERVMTLPQTGLTIGRGLLYPTLQHLGQAGLTEWASFPPRFRGHEPELGATYGAEVRDAGLRAAWAWLRNCLFAPPEPSPLVA